MQVKGTSFRTLCFEALILQENHFWVIPWNFFKDQNISFLLLQDYHFRPYHLIPLLAQYSEHYFVELSILPCIVKVFCQVWQQQSGWWGSGSLWLFLGHRHCHTGCPPPHPGDEKQAEHQGSTILKINIKNSDRLLICLRVTPPRFYVAFMYLYAKSTGSSLNN